MNKEQFVKAMWAWCKDNGIFMWPEWDLESEWQRYQKGRSWCNEFFSNEGAKYVE